MSLQPMRDHALRTCDERECVPVLCDILSWYRSREFDRDRLGGVGALAPILEPLCVLRAADEPAPDDGPCRCTMCVRTSNNWCEDSGLGSVHHYNPQAKWPEKE